MTEEELLRRVRVALTDELADAIEASFSKIKREARAKAFDEAAELLVGKPQFDEARRAIRALKDKP